MGGCKTARLCLFSTCNSDWVVIGECGWGGVYTGVLVAERRNTLGEQSQWCGKGEVLPVVELGETTERQAQLGFERQVVLQAAMPGQRAGRGVRNRGM